MKKMVLITAALFVTMLFTSGCHLLFENDDDSGSGSGPIYNTGALTLSPSPGTYVGTQLVTISSPEPSAVICYTIGDGTQAAPTIDTGLTYSGPFAVSACRTIKAIAVFPDNSTSELSRGDYIIQVQRLIAAGTAGNYCWSDDGVTWSAVSNISGLGDVKNIKYGNGRFVAVSSTSPCKAAWSVNGINWSTPVQVNTDPYNRMAFNGTYFITVGFPGIIARSTNGVNWDLTTFNTDDITAICVRPDGTFVFMNDNASSASSSDGLNWTWGGFIAGGGDYAQDIVFMGNLAIGVTSQGDVYTSTNGTGNWTVAASLNPLGVLNSTKILNVNNILWAEGWDNASTATVCMSSNSGVTWYESDVISTSRIKSFIHQGGYFYAGTAGNQIFRSSNGINWGTAVTPGITSVNALCGATVNVY